jgi:S1-C subfamily serine protease
MSSDGVKGLKLQGITPDSPADKAGLRAGDVVVAMDDAPVTDLYTYTDALYARKPGDVLKVTVLRGAERVTVSVTLGQRGQ